MVTGEGSRRSVFQEAESVVLRAARQEMEKAFYNCITSIPRQLVGGAQHTRYYLKFQNKICDPLYTSRKIKGKAGSDVEIALFDNDKKVTVTSDPLSSIEVEIVVLNGDFNNDDRETWSEEEFNKRIALPRDTKGSLLTGKRLINLNNGIGSFTDIVFTDNSSSQRTKKFRLGVRYTQSVPNGERIQEGITEPLRVKDRRVESYQKHHTPSLDDEVWRLKHIMKNGIYHKRLQGLGIKTVQDFLRYYNSDESKLRKILGSRFSPIYWEEVVKHAKECDLGDNLYSFSMRENSVVPVVLFFNSIYSLVGVKFGDCYTTLDNLDTSQQDSVESWKNLAYGNINGMQFDHRMINGNPIPLFSSDVTFLPGPSSLPHISTFQTRNSAILADQVYSQVGLPQETSIAGKNSRDLFMERTSSIDLHNHQTEQYTFIAETRNLPLEMGNSSFDNITTSALNSEFPGLPVTHNASEACYGTQPYSLGIESLEQSRTTVKDVPFARDNSLVSTLPMEITPTEDTFYPQIYEQGSQMCSQSQVESSPFMESLRVQPTFSRMNSLDPSFFEGLIQTSINNLPASLGGETSRSFSRMSSFDPSFFEGLIQTSINNLPASSCGETSRSFSRMSSFDPSFFEGLIQTPINNLPTSSGGETSRSIAPPSRHPRWVPLLAPIKWVHFAKKRRARNLIRQTFVATV